MVQLLQDSSDLVLELSAQTDSRGSQAYNLLLSKRRALAAAGYIVNIGIDPERINVKYCGESKLLYNPQKDSDKEDIHKLNRLTEFRLLRSNSGKDVVASTNGNKCFTGCNTLSNKELLCAGESIKGKIVQNQNFYLITGSFHNKYLAVSYRKKLMKKGYSQTRILHDNKQGFYRISIKGFEERQNALSGLKEVRSRAKDLNVWLLQK